MNIGQLAQLSGLAASRIRFYEAQGLLPQVQRQANGYRRYPPQILQTLEIIQCAQQAGFSLDELKQLLPGCESSDLDHQALLQSLERKVGQIEDMQRHLAQSKAQLLEIIDNIRDRPEGMDCSENAERVMASIKGGKS
ncbi:MerR family transcriptional regulator [Pseudomonas sp. GM17]|uniref:MerR family transcriptional regulator n=1 Tax=Pseudomonas sp. GM17 TaxID=1144323 RepID=UPI0002726248|nr:MerR family transcriptional regulator [Pseudomonas sp. GM17]WIE48336.1 MerR family transcriptional regulator [Pseudomonas sp. GM17]